MARAWYFSVLSACWSFDSGEPNFSLTAQQVAHRESGNASPATPMAGAIVESLAQHSECPFQVRTRLFSVPSPLQFLPQDHLVGTVARLVTREDERLCLGPSDTPEINNLTQPASRQTSPPTSRTELQRKTGGRLGRAPDIGWVSCLRTSSTFRPSAVTLLRRHGQHTAPDSSGSGHWHDQPGLGHLRHP